jgi:phosphoribosylformylglycinamidine (FGAM) synthase PurS component
MPQNVLIEVATAGRAAAAHSAKNVRHQIHAAGVRDVSCEGVSFIYRLEGAMSAEEIEKIAREILCDSVVEQFKVNSRPSDKETIYADVWYKQGVTDAVGDSVMKAVRDMGIQSVRKASAGTRTIFHSMMGPWSGDATLETTVRHFTNQNLLNPLVQECRIFKL